jgi:hypothetical protein
MSNSEQKLSLAKDAAKVRFPPFLFDLPNTPRTKSNVSKGLRSAFSAAEGSDHFGQGLEAGK